MADPPFRFTRESKIRIDVDGYLWHEGERVVHDGLAKALASWIEVDAASDRYILRNALDWCFITVDDAPLVVRSVHVGDAGAVLELSDGTSEALDPASLRIDGHDVPYCDVKGGRLPARFSRSAAFGLLQHARAEGEQIALALPTGSFPLRTVAAGAGAPKRAPTRPEV